MTTSTAITTPMSPGADNFMFRVSLADSTQVSAIVTYAAKHKADPKIALMAETTGYGEGALAEAEALPRSTTCRSLARGSSTLPTPT